MNNYVEKRYRTDANVSHIHATTGAAVIYIFGWELCATLTAQIDHACSEVVVLRLFFFALVKCTLSFRFLVLTTIYTKNELLQSEF